MNKINISCKGLSTFIFLWATQMLSGLGSSMTGFALIVWSYEQQGSALTTALLTVCSYVPYVLLSIFAGTLSDRWSKKKIMLICDSLAACTTLVVMFMFQNGTLQIWHLYLLNAINGFMNSIQNPASNVAISLIVPKEQYQKVSGMQSFSNSLVTLLTPSIATAVLMLIGIRVILLFDLLTFAIAFITLAFFIDIPDYDSEQNNEKISMLKSAGQGLEYLKNNRGIFGLIAFLAAINLIASMSNSARVAMFMSREGAGETALGIVNTCMGIANVCGSIFVSLYKSPKSRVRVICNTLLFAMSTENLIFALGRNVPIWCIGTMLGWIAIPVMSTNITALFRTYIPIELQGRVYSVRNTFQYFTIPIGYMLGGFLVDNVCEPLMAKQHDGSILTLLLGQGKGTGAALVYLFIAVAGVLVCLIFRRNKDIWKLEETGL